MKVPDYQTAHTILGMDFIAPEEVTKALPNIVYTHDQLWTLAGSLPSGDTLKWCKDNDYAIMSAPPTAMTWLDLLKLNRPYFLNKIDGTAAIQKFSREETTSVGWLAVKKKAIQDSDSMTWDEQNKLLSVVERVPNVAEISWFFIAYFEVRGVGLWLPFGIRDGEKIYLVNFFFRTSSQCDHKEHATIACTPTGNFWVRTSQWDYDADCRCGLWPARKL